MINTFITPSHEWENHHWAVITAIAGYAALVWLLRHRRMKQIQAPFSSGKRQLSSMTVKESYEIIEQLQTLEFPYAFAKGRRMALLKV